MTSEKGFSLMELMVVVAIIAVLSAFAVPNMVRWRSNMQFNNGVRMLKSAIESTRMSAIKSNMSARMTFVDGGNSFDTVEWDLEVNNFGAARTNPLPTGVVLESSDFADDRLQFTSRGMPQGGVGGVLVLQNTAGDLCRRIVVDNVGTTRIVECP
jgi:type IV fimbrial biogenesis protein FimT